MLWQFGLCNFLPGSAALGILSFTSTDIEGTTVETGLISLLLVLRSCSPTELNGLEEPRKTECSGVREGSSVIGNIYPEAYESDFVEGGALLVDLIWLVPCILASRSSCLRGST